MKLMNSDSNKTGATPMPTASGAKTRRSVADLRPAVLTLLKSGAKTAAQIREALGVDHNSAHNALRSLQLSGDALQAPTPPASTRDHARRGKGSLWFANPYSFTNMLEKTLESKICDYAKMLGVATYKFTSPGVTGVPDRIFVFPGGRVAFMEIKRLGQKPTALQMAEIAKLVRLGASAAWFDNAEEACRWLNGLYNKRT